MAYTIRRIDYFHTTVQDQPGESFTALSGLARQGVNLLAFTAVPVGSHLTRLTVYPEDTSALARAAERAGMSLEGPNRALLVQGDDELGALAGIHAKLYRANVNVYASNCVADGRGSYGYVIHVRPEDLERAAGALEI